VKVPKLAVDHSHPSSYKVTNEWSCISALPTYFLGVNRTFAFHKSQKAKLCLVGVFRYGLKISYIIFNYNYKYLLFTDICLSCVCIYTYIYIYIYIYISWWLFDTIYLT
jgi:hypothetical protein